MRGGVLRAIRLLAGWQSSGFPRRPAETGHDLMLLTLNPRGVTPLLETRANELNAAISPDGKWLALSVR